MAITFTPERNTPETEIEARAAWIASALRIADDHGLTISEVPAGDGRGIKGLGSIARFVVPGLGSFGLPWREHEPGDLCRAVVAQLNERGGL